MVRASVRGSVDSRRAFGLNRLAPTGTVSHLCPGHERLGLFYVKGSTAQSAFLCRLLLVGDCHSISLNPRPKASATACLVMAMATDQAAQQLRQLGDVNGYAPCLVPRHQIRSRPASRLIFVISVSERVPVVVLHNEARAVVIDRPRWREAATGHRLVTD